MARFFLQIDLIGRRLRKRYVRVRRPLVATIYYFVTKMSVIGPFVKGKLHEMKRLLHCVR